VRGEAVHLRLENAEWEGGGEGCWIGLLDATAAHAACPLACCAVSAASESFAVNKDWQFVM
jgi:hypothetical protein